MMTRAFTMTIGRVLVAGFCLAPVAVAHAEEEPERPRTAPSESPEPTLGMPLVTVEQIGQHQKAWAQAKQEGPFKRVGTDAQGFAMRTFGLRGGTWLSREPSDRNAVIGAQEFADALFHVGFWSARYRDQVAIGYDGKDITYSLALDASLGAMLPLGKGHGPVLRAAMRGELFQLGGFNFGQLVLPGGEAGYSYSQGPLQWELIGSLGPALVGEFRYQSSRLDLSGLVWGGGVTFRWQALSFRLDAAATELGAGRRSAETRGHLCGLLGGRPAEAQSSTRGKNVRVRAGRHARDFRVAICADFSSILALGASESGPALPGNLGPALNEASLTQVGLSLMFGRISRLDTLKAPTL